MSEPLVVEFDANTCTDFDVSEHTDGSGEVFKIVSLHLIPGDRDVQLKARDNGKSWTFPATVRN